MYRLYLILLLNLSASIIYANNRKLLDELDATIEQRNQFVSAKNERINFIKGKITAEKDSTIIMEYINDLFEEYHVFQFDSALVYANKGRNLAIRQHNNYYASLFTIHLAEILAKGGMYSEAINHLDNMTIDDESNDLMFRYHYAYFTTYTYWSDYCNDSMYSEKYRHKASENLDLAMHHANKDNELINFYLGEQQVYVDGDPAKAREFYHNILNTVDEKSRIYAMASFALAGNYRISGNEEKYEEYLIKAALSDLKASTMENLALQSLAILLFEKSDKDIERADHYINVSMADAKYYNNKLRIIEIARFMPQIMNAYQASMKTKNRTLLYLIISISILGIGLLFTAYYIFRQNRKLHSRRKELAAQYMQTTDLNRQLENSYKDQTSLNDQLKDLNERLINTNKRRESLASIYIDLCAKYIDKLNKYQTLVKRKIRANQAQELLQTLSSTRISEEDAAVFLNRFDKAFIELYPTFVNEFNNLLQEGSRLEQKSKNSLTTEIRIFALIRLGVKSTADIAGLLFLSTQTIYNSRSTIKKLAKNKDTFDDDVLRLCTTIGSHEQEKEEQESTNLPHPSATQQADEEHGATEG